jgi:DNA-binding ferritin-like protein
MAPKTRRDTKRNKRTTNKRRVKTGAMNKKAGPNPNQRSHIVMIFMEMLNTVKIYHWKTHSFSQHKATDELYTKLNEHIDTFIETLLGKDGSRIKLMENEIQVLDESNTTDFRKRIFEYRSFLINMNMYFDSRNDTDLLNIRDEILGDINQFLYLLTFNK